MGSPEYFKKWYEANKASLAERRNKKYQGDPKYRKRALASNARYYKAIKNKKLDLSPIARLGNDDYYSMAQVSQKVGRTSNTVRKIISRLGIHPRRIGKNVTLTEQQIEQVKIQCHPRKKSKKPAP